MSSTDTSRHDQTPMQPPSRRPRGIRRQRTTWAIVGGAAAVALTPVIAVGAANIGGGLSGAPLDGSGIVVQPLPAAATADVSTQPSDMRVSPPSPVSPATAADPAPAATPSPVTPITPASPVTPKSPVTPNSPVSPRSPNTPN